MKEFNYPNVFCVGAALLIAYFIFEPLSWIWPIEPLLNVANVLAILTLITLILWLFLEDGGARKCKAIVRTVNNVLF